MKEEQIFHNLLARIGLLIEQTEKEIKESKESAPRDSNNG